jgi:hypothetical protein
MKKAYYIENVLKKLGFHHVDEASNGSAWVAGTSPAMTMWKSLGQRQFLLS